jgi:hypothetical protein
MYQDPMLIYQGAAAPCTPALGVGKLPHWKYVHVGNMSISEICPCRKYGMPVLLSEIWLSEILQSKKWSSAKSRGAYKTAM